jgi:hypothetical protein
MCKINKSLVFWVACLIFSTYICFCYVTFSVKSGTKQDVFEDEKNYSFTYITSNNNSISDEDRQDILNALELYNSSAIVYPRDGTPFIYLYTPSAINNISMLKGRFFTEQEFNDVESEHISLAPSNTGLAYYFNRQEPFVYSDNNYKTVGVLDRSHPYFNMESKDLVPLSKIGSVHSGEWYFSSTEKEFLGIIKNIFSKYSVQEVSFHTEDVNLLKSILTISIQDKWGRAFFIAIISALGFLLFATEIEIKRNKRLEFIKFSVGARKKSEYKYFILRRLTEILIGWLIPFVLLLVFDKLGTSNNSIDFSYVNFTSSIFVLTLMILVLLIDSIMYFSLSFKRNGERL